MKSDEREEESGWVSTNLLNEEDDRQGSLTKRRRERANSQDKEDLTKENGRKGRSQITMR